MKTINEMLDILPQAGTVEWIGVRPERKIELISNDSVEISKEYGIKGDHYSQRDGKRMVTLIQAEHLNTVASILQVKIIDPKLLRRNIVVSGINLLALHDRTFQIGDQLILKGTGYCQPCSRMEQNLGDGGYNAMRGHGGITAKVIRSGKIAISNKVKIIL